jgi:S-adenosylmethionine-diacylglycerol 3-amino-3-carboxypropyl transferase
MSGNHEKKTAVLRYANVWEDPEVLLQAMPESPGARLFSIAGGGDNALALLSRRPSLVMAVDLNQAELSVLELKRAAIKFLAREETLILLGFRQGLRWDLFRKAREALSPWARSWWDAHEGLVSEGIIHAGKFEGYFRTFRRFVLPLMVSCRDLRAAAELKTEEERRLFFQKRVDTPRWRFLFRLFFSRAVMSRLGREPDCFRYVEEKLAPALMERTKHALTALEPTRNPFLEYILTGGFKENLPLYMRPEIYPVVRGNLDALFPVHGSAEEVLARQPAASLDGFNLSDIFEYMGEPEARRNWEAAIRAGRPGTRLAYWNMIVPRQGSIVMPDRLHRLEELSERLFREDRAFFYSAFHVEEVA